MEQKPKAVNTDAGAKGEKFSESFIGNMVTKRIEEKDFMPAQNTSAK